MVSAVGNFCDILEKVSQKIDKQNEKIEKQNEKLEKEMSSIQENLLEQNTSRNIGINKVRNPILSNDNSAAKKVSSLSNIILASATKIFVGVLCL